MIPEEKPVWGTEITREMVDPGYGNMWSVGLKHYKCKEDSSDRYIINDGRLRAGHARVAIRQGVEWRKTTKNTLQYFEDEADYRLYVGINAGIVYNSDPTSRISNCWDGHHFRHALEDISHLKYWMMTNQPPHYTNIRTQRSVLAHQKR